MDYPMKPATLRDPVKYDVGCKVSWYFYDDEEQAKIASDYYGGPHRSYQMSQGFDFGYQVPGSTTKTKDGLWCVVIG